MYVLAYKTIICIQANTLDSKNKRVKQHLIK